MSFQLQSCINKADLWLLKRAEKERQLSPLPRIWCLIARLGRHGPHYAPGSAPQRRGPAGMGGSEHPGWHAPGIEPPRPRAPFHYVPSALHLSDGARSEEKEEMSRKQLSRSFLGLGLAAITRSLPAAPTRVGKSPIPSWGHRGHVTLAQARGCCWDAPDTDAVWRLPAPCSPRPACSVLASSP